MLQFRNPSEVKAALANKRRTERVATAFTVGAEKALNDKPCDFRQSHSLVDQISTERPNSQTSLKACGTDRTHSAPDPEELRINEEYPNRASTISAREKKMRWQVWPLAIYAILMTSVMALASEKTVSDTDAAGIRSVIDRQIAAFRSDDGAAAYSFAAPSIQKMFPSVPRFMDMVRRGYAPVYRPRSYSFEDLRTENGATVQVVRLVGPAGAEWLAFYTLDKQADGSWKITGVYLQKAPGQTT